MNKYKTTDELDLKVLHVYELLSSIGIVKYKRTFCHAIDLVEQNFSKICNGDNQHFSTRHIIKLCQVYGVDANWFVGTSKDIFLKKREQNVNKSA